MRGRKEEKTAGGRQKWKERRERRGERRGDGRKPAVSDRGWGGVAAGEARAWLKIEGAKEGSASRKNQPISGKKEQEGPTKTTPCVARNADWLVVEARVRNRGGSGPPPELALARQRVGWLTDTPLQPPILRCRLVILRSRSAWRRPRPVQQPTRAACPLTARRARRVCRTVLGSEAACRRPARCPARRE